MTMAPSLRKLALATHIVSSIGWIGALVGFLVLAIVGLASADLQTVRAVYIAMDLTARFAIVPLALISLSSGIIQALATPWGLFRHYWVLFKLLIVVIATFMLLMKTGPISSMAQAAAGTPFSGTDLAGLRFSILGHAVGGLVVLLWAATLGIYKPRGLTRHGRRKQLERHPIPQT